MNKRGQFYIIAAIIIVLVLAGIASIKTYTITKSRPETISDMASTLNVEGSQIVDYGIYKGYEGEEINTLLDGFANDFKDYFAEKTEQTEIVLIYGDSQGNLKGQKITTQTTGDVTLVGTGSPFKRTSVIPLDPTQYHIKEGVITVKMLNNEFDFNLRENQMFYFVIKQEEGGETYIERNK